MKQIRALSTKGYTRQPNNEFNVSTSHFLATQRRVAKQKEQGGSNWHCSDCHVVVYTRDVKIVNTEIGVVSIGVKRNSINRAKKKLAKLISRGASKRQIDRAGRRVEFMISAEKTRKERAAEKKAQL